MFVYMYGIFFKTHSDQAIVVVTVTVLIQREEKTLKILYEYSRIILVSIIYIVFVLLYHLEIHRCAHTHSRHMELQKRRSPYRWCIPSPSTDQIALPQECYTICEQYSEFERHKVMVKELCSWP